MWRRWWSVAESLALFTRRRGGITHVLGKVLRLWRREGWRGLQRAWNVLVRGGLVGQQYLYWIRRYDTVTPAHRAAMQARIARLPAQPLISVLMPTYNPNLAWLEAAVASVRRQAYPHWELCIADDASRDAAVAVALRRLAAEDPRIRVTFRAENGHIAAASNSALALARGDWIALLDHDDQLAEHALFWVADALNRHPDARLLYSDEDKLAGSTRCHPYFKSDWNPELFHSQNMVCHLGVYHAALVREVGGFRPGFEGAQDYDLALRCVERIDPSRIRHIPRVLYHWRMHDASTAARPESKPYAQLAGQRALEEHFRRQGVAARVELRGSGYRIRHPLPDPVPHVSVIIPTRNGLALLRRCIDSIRERTTYPAYDIVVIDNGSDDPQCLSYLETLERTPGVRVRRDARAFNFSALNNAAVAQCRGEVVALVNNDIEVITPGWLEEMVSHALRPGVGAVGAKLLYPDDTVQHAGVVLGMGGVAGHAHWGLPREAGGYFERAILAQSYSAVTAACLVVRRDAYQAAGGLNETELAIAFNDVDFCLRLREAGLRNVWTPFAELYHHESASRGLEDTPEKQARFAREVAYMKRRWGRALLSDPAYSPNLSLDHSDSNVLAWPPRVELLLPPN